MTSPPRDARTWPTGLVLLVASVAAGVGFFLFPERGETRVVVAGAIVAGSCIVAAWVIGVTQVRRSAWKGAGHLATALLLLAAGDLAFMLFFDYPARQPHASAADLAFLVFAIPIFLAVRDEFRLHFPPDSRREIWVDVMLVTVSLTVIAYVMLRPTAADGVMSASAAVFAILAAVQFAAFGGLALWVPSGGHLVQFAIMTGLATATALFGWQWVHGTFRGTSLEISLLFAAAVLSLAAFVRWSPESWKPGKEARVSRWGRPVLTSAAVAAALAALAFVSMSSDEGSVSRQQATWLIGALGVCVVLRIVANQVRGVQANERVRTALDQKEVALREADTALDRVREANETLRESEEHLRLVFETAVDGIVELDAKDLIVRANDAFCQMVNLPREVIEGQPWTAVAAAVKGADGSFATLPSTGQGQINREGQPLYLESRTSAVPIMPPRKLLLVRDVTAAKIADQTIRSLFKFLQDRDEDRTNILRRTNAAIESERNRVARDLHDGPVQGVSAASLSLEAALLMIRAGEIERGIEVLSRIRLELSDEADALRLLMSGLRPPLLEERGLIPALRETLTRFGTDHGVETRFTAGAMVSVPDDIETLAYRVVQEALSNCGKHANASRVTLHVETDASQLRVEVADDGIGFDSGMSREFLRSGRVGLASMRERVELANGTLAVHSTLGRGTTITATMPLDVITLRELAPSQQQAGGASSAEARRAT
jgi:signal transduction histidine kinase